MNRPFKILGVEHIGIAVSDLNKGTKILNEILGIPKVSTEKIIDQGIVTDIFKTDTGKLELIKSIKEKSIIERFINKRGNAIHHIALAVDDLDSALKYLKKKDIRLIDEKPRIGAEGYKIAFINPKDTFGILIELCEKDNRI